MGNYSHIIGASGGRYHSAGFAAAAKPVPCASYSELLVFFSVNKLFSLRHPSWHLGRTSRVR